MVSMASSSSIVHVCTMEISCLDFQDEGGFKFSRISSRAKVRSDLGRQNGSSMVQTLMLIFHNAGPAEEEPIKECQEETIQLCQGEEGTQVTGPPWKIDG